METFVRMGGKCFEEYVDIPNSGRRNVEKKCRRKYFGSDDSTTEESIRHTEAYHTESGEQVEASDEIAPKAVPTGGKQKRIGTPIIDTERAVQNKSTERAQSKHQIHGRKGKEAVVPILSIAEWTLTPGQFKKGIRSKSTRKTASKAFDIQDRGGPRMSTPIPEPGTKRNTV